MKLNWNTCGGGGGVQNKKPIGECGINGTAHCGTETMHLI